MHIRNNKEEKVKLLLKAGKPPGFAEEQIAQTVSQIIKRGAEIFKSVN